RVLRVDTAPIEGRDGDLVAAVSILTDDTERRHSEEDLRQAVTELARSNADLEQFAYVASHDLREPLRKMAGYAEIVSRRYRDRIDGRADRWLERISAGAVKMNAMIGALLLYSRVGRDSLPMVTVEMRAILEH